MTASIIKHYDPFWLHALTAEKRGEVVEWLSGNGIDPDICAYFRVFADANGKAEQVKCRIYKTSYGRPIWNSEKQEPEFDSDQVFSPKWLPTAIEQDLPRP